MRVRSKIWKIRYKNEKNEKGWFLAAKKQHMVTIAAKIVTVIDTKLSQDSKTVGLVMLSLQLKVQ